MSPLFVAVAAVIGWRAGQDVANARFAETPVVPEDWRELSGWLETYDPTDIVLTQPSTAWVIAAALGVALVYTLSVIAHELGHFLAARALGAEVKAVELDAAGGYVEMLDDDRLTPEKRATVVAAGPLVTAILALGAFIALRVLGWPLADLPDLQTGAGVAAGRILATAFWINVIALAVNLLPLRTLDGGQLLSAARLWVGRSARGET
jgi:membrane-associated protease RseP (regulator of RpoE activity)